MDFEKIKHTKYLEGMSSQIEKFKGVNAQELTNALKKMSIAGKKASKAGYNYAKRFILLEQECQSVNIKLTRSKDKQ